MRTVLAAIATGMTIAAIPVIVVIALDYGNHIMNNKRLLEDKEQWRDYQMLEICKNYRAFQKMPEGRDTNSMDDICDEIEGKFKKSGGR